MSGVFTLVNPPKRAPMTETQRADERIRKYGGVVHATLDAQSHATRLAPRPQPVEV